jgi:cytochrome oxidase assembly protein ShyY1
MTPGATTRGATTRGATVQGPRPGVRGVLAVLREPYWLRAALVVVLLSVAFVLLGRWQWGRHEGKVARAEQIDSGYDAPAVALQQLLPHPAGPLPAGTQWRPFRARGSYLPADGVVVRNRPNENGEFGYEVVVPFRVEGGPVLLVDRGWIPNGESGARPDSVPAPPSGVVTVVARLRPSEPGARDAPPGQAERIDVPRLTVGLGAPAVTGAYAVLAAEHPTTPEAPALLPRPDEDLGPHLAYAIQWWLGVVVVYVLLVVYASKEAQRRADESADEPTDRATGEATGGATGGGTGEVSAEPVSAPSGRGPARAAALQRPTAARRTAAGLTAAGRTAAGRIAFGRAEATVARAGGGRRSGRRELTDEEWEDLADARMQAGVRDGVVGRGPGVDDHDPGARPSGHVDE